MKRLLAVFAFALLAGCGGGNVSDDDPPDIQPTGCNAQPRPAMCA